MTSLGLSRAAARVGLVLMLTWFVLYSAWMIYLALAFRVAGGDAVIYATAPDARGPPPVGGGHVGSGGVTAAHISRTTCVTLASIAASS